MSVLVKVKVKVKVKGTVGLALLGCSRELNQKYWSPQCRTDPYSTPRRPEPCLVPSAHVSHGQRAIVPRRPVCLSLWKQRPLLIFVRQLNKVTDCFQPQPQPISLPFIVQRQQWYVFWWPHDAQVRPKKAVNDPSFMDPVQNLLMTHNIIWAWFSNFWSLFKTKVSRPPKVWFQ